jgi:hypothetical protein
MVMLEVINGIVNGVNPLLWLELGLNNLHWSFAIFAFVYITYKDAGFGKHYIRNFLLLTLLLWAAGSIFNLIDLVILSPGIFLIFQFFFSIYWDGTPWQKRFPTGMLVIYLALVFLLGFLITFGVM